MHLSVAIVVVNWNGEAQSRRCVRSLLDLDYPAYRIYLIDNGSTDGSALALAAEFPEIEVIALRENRGYAGGCNAGIAAARAGGARYVWLLNNDTTVDPRALSALESRSRQLIAPAILSPKILAAEPPHHIWSAGGVLQRPWLKSDHAGIGLARERFTRPRRLDWASGCSLFFPLDAVDRAGPLDERYFLYLEDVDWCMRARRAGVHVWYEPGAEIYHDISGSVGALDPRIVRYYAYRNYYLLAFTNSGPAGRAFFAAHFAVTLAKIAVRSLFFSAYRNDGYYHARTRAMFDVLRRRFGRAPYADGRIAVPTPALREESRT